jgi:phosphatidylglycerol:prolipoprotein diacylglycerol transferase
MLKKLRKGIKKSTGKESKMIIGPYVLLNIIAAIYLLISAYIVFGRNGTRKTHFIIIALFMIAGYIFGARLLYSIIYFERAAMDLEKLFELRLVNFAMYGGLILSFTFWLIAGFKFKLPVMKLSDGIIPHMGIALAISKMGCFINGCCYGRPTSMPWGMTFHRADLNPLKKFPGVSALTKYIFPSSDILRHPAQLYEVIFALAAACAAYYLNKKKTRQGLPFVVFLMIYTAGRFISFLYRDFPVASELSNVIRGPIVYGVIWICCIVYLFKLYSPRTKIE